MNRYLFKFKALATAGALLAMPALLRASEEAGEAAGIGPKDYWTMGIKIFDFAILVFILVRFLAKPLADYVSTRAAAIRSRLENLQAKKVAAVEAEETFAKRLTGIEDEIIRLKKSARLEMEKEKEEVLAEARRVAQEIIQHAREKVKQEFAKARADLHQEAVHLSLELAEGLIVKHLDDKDQRRFAEEYIRNIGRQS